MKLRVRYQVTEEGRFLGHLDLTRTVMKVLSRAQLPVMFSEGFNPHPKISFAMPLSVGHISNGEFFEIVLKERVNEENFKERFNEFAPQAIKALEVKEVMEKLDSMSSIINSAKYLLTFRNTDKDLLKEAMKGIMEKKEIVILKKSKKKTKETDIRPLIYDIVFVAEKNGECTLEVFLAHGSKENLKVQDLINLFAEYGILTDYVSTERLGLFLVEGSNIADLMEVLTNVG